MRKPGRGQILENRLVGPREVLGGGDRRVPAKGRGRTAPCRGRSGASWIWATPLTPARARGSSVRATPSLRPPRILKTSLFLQKGGPRKEPSQRTATALFYLIPCGDFQLSPREFYLSLISPGFLASWPTLDCSEWQIPRRSWLGEDSARRADADAPASAAFAPGRRDCLA